MIIYPAIDLLAGRCVRLTHGDFTKCTVYSEDPVAVAKGFAQAGATHLHVVDLEGSRSGEPVESRIIHCLVRDSGLKVQVGGGIRRVEHARELIALGVDRIVLGSLAVRDPGGVRQLLQEYGGERVTLALDLRLEKGGAETAKLATDGWTQEAADTPWSVLRQFLSWGGTSVLVTDIGRDGALAGTNLALYKFILERYAGVSLMASGGVSSSQDVEDLSRAGAYAAVIGKALYEGRLSLEEAIRCS